MQMTSGVTYMGLDCLADMSNPLYTQYSTESQTAIPWASQAAYAKYTIYFGVVIIFIALIKHVYYLARDRSYENTNSSKNGVKYTPTNPFYSFLDVIIAYGRFVGYKQTPRWATFFLSVPNSIGSTLFMMVSSFYLLAYCLIPHFWYRSCAGFGSPPLAVRAGMMSTALMPFIYILLGKTNAITLFTGISYEKLNVFHQFVGVAAFILGVIHTIPFIYQTLHEGGSSLLYQYFTTDAYYISGIPALIILGLLCTLSKSWLRKRYYEVFCHVHWMMGLAFIGLLIWHIDKALDAQDYMWGALAFWAAQFIYRLLIKTCFKPTTMFLRSRTAHLEKLSEQVYQITIDNVQGYKWKPGQHCFLRFKGLRILDSHPFSISTCSQGQGMKFIVIPKKGLTRSQYQKLDKQIELNTKVYIDGPYGGTFRDVLKFDNVVLLASGSGVTATIPFVLYLADQFNNASASIPTLKCLSFVWVIRERNHESWFREELDRCKAILGDKLHIDIRVCHDSTNNATPSSSNFDDSSSDQEKLIESKDSNPIAEANIKLHDKSCHHASATIVKPNIPQIVHNLAASTFQRRNMIVCSGSESMKRQVSSTVSKLQGLVFNNDRSRTQIEEIYLHTESFGW